MNYEGSLNGSVTCLNDTRETIYGDMAEKRQGLCHPRRGRAINGNQVWKSQQALKNNTRSFPVQTCLLLICFILYLILPFSLKFKRHFYIFPV